MLRKTEIVTFAGYKPRLANGWNALRKAAGNALAGYKPAGAPHQTTTKKPTMETKGQLLTAAANAAIAAGGEIMEVYTDPAQDFGIELKADNSPLTQADRRADATIAAALKPTGISILSEESAHAPYPERSSWQRLWIVDPLDGTKEFIKKNGDFTVNIALAEGGRPTMGVIYVPATRELYWGAPGMGAGKLTAVGTEARFASASELAAKSAMLPLAGGPRPFTVVASRSHLNAETQACIDGLCAEHGHVATLSRGSSLKLCMVAEGKADVYPRFAPTMEWDTAAGHAIAVAAGCEVVSADNGQPLRYNKPDLHNPWFIVRRPAASTPKP